jgi:hypothetical protein
VVGIASLHDAMHLDHKVPDSPLCRCCHVPLSPDLLSFLIVDTHIVILVCRRRVPLGPFLDLSL